MTSLIASSAIQLDIQVFQSKVEINKDHPNEISKYTYRYRILKTVLLIFAWISFGINNEIIASTYEDLKILLNLNYNGIATALVLNSVGFLCTMFISGYLYDRFSSHAELLMAISGFFLVTPNYLIPVFDNYMLTYLCFFIRGSAGAIWDIGGNHIVLKVWEGISTSPLNAMHAGYGIGGILAVQLSKPFIKFNCVPINGNFSNLSITLKPEDIIIQTPYFIASTIGVVLVICFIISHLVETRNERRYREKLHQNDQEKVALKIAALDSEPKNDQTFIKSLFFGDKNYKGKALCYMSVQISLITVIFFFLAGYIAIICKFMLTYLTKGPAQMSVNTYTTIQTLYWAVFVFSRFLTAIFAFNINPIVFIFFLFLANAIVCGLFIVPILTEYSLFFWVGMVLMGFTSGPMQPSSYMVAKKLLVEYNTFTMSVFSIGVALGSIFFQEIAGRLLDYFNEPSNNIFFEYPASVIAYLFFFTSFFISLIFIPSWLIYTKYVDVLQRFTKN